jgi:hypothetical protein
VFKLNSQLAYKVKYFNSAEEVWFWYAKNQLIRDVGAKFDFIKQFERPCSIDDVNNLATALYLAGELKKNHIQIMLKYGEKMHVPSANVEEEAEDAVIWEEAMGIFSFHLRKKGFIKAN